MSKLTRKDWKKWFNNIKFTEESVQYLGADLCGSVLEEIGKTFLQSHAEAPMRKPRVSKEEIFVQHIENHLKEMGIDGKVICKICGKDIDSIAQEAGMEVEHK